MSKLWEKSVSLDKMIESFTVGNDPELDQVLVPFDCKASKAHAKMLGQKGYLTAQEVDNIISELDQIIKRHAKGDFKIKVSQEDCHTAIEEYLVEELGEVGKKIHMARSRNDQVLTALRLYYKDELMKINSLSKAWIDNLTQFGDNHQEVNFPGYTHMQKAMPSSIHMWANAYVDSMKDDLKSLDTVSSLVDQSPLGSAAGYGVPIIIDSKMTAEEMGFTKVQENPIYCQLSRGKFELAILQVLSQILLTINRLASDLMQFSMAEFEYFSLPEDFCTGSSIMPQKENPDVLELLRANYHILLGYETQVKTLTSNLISGYNRDIQLSKEPVMRSIKLVKDCLGISAAVVSGLTVNNEKCQAAMTSEIYATEKAYEMVKEGIPFREAYRKVAALFREED
tara:strand:- start:118 stop:1308 length:1191 start_codon:yes stop_codon:yes gene_type:complete